MLRNSLIAQDRLAVGDATDDDVLVLADQFIDVFEEFAAAVGVRPGRNRKD